MLKVLGGAKGGTTLRLGAFGCSEALILHVLTFRGMGRGTGSPTSLDKERKK